MSANTDLVSLLTPIGLAVITIISAFCGAWINSWFARRSAVEEENRDTRKQIYKDTYFGIVNIINTNGADPDDKFHEAYNSMIFYAPDKVLEATIMWWADMQSQGGKSEINSDSLKKMLNEMRKDLKLTKTDAFIDLNFQPIGKNVKRAG